VTRLIDMGMDPFNFADSLLAVIAQRLVRRLCTHCREPREASPEELEELLRDHLHVFKDAAHAPGPDEVMKSWQQRFGSSEGGRSCITTYRAVGCKRCDDSGFRGRAGIHELLTVTHTLRHLIQTNARSEELLQAATAEGMRTLRQDGIEKVLAGITTIEEVRANSN
jgi:type II secretory ATPase GspE/PulE/Tfp pilus assembly ATPase PilB-like protein